MQRADSLDVPEDFPDPSIQLNHALVPHGWKVTTSPFERFDPKGPPGSSRYQYWKNHVLPAVTAPGPDESGSAA